MKLQENNKKMLKPDLNLYILAWLVVAMFFVLTGLLMFVNVPEKNVGPVNQLFGAMGTGFGYVLHYFFGTSKGSQDKTNQIIDMKKQ